MGMREDNNGLCKNVLSACINIAVEMGFPLRYEKALSDHVYR